MNEKERVLLKISHLPDAPGCYIFKGKRNKVIYVGKANSLKKRVSSYFRKNKDLKTRKLVDEIVELDYIVVSNEVEALFLENTLIKKYSPRYNVRLKDDKTYPFLRVTSEPVPSVTIVRRIISDGAMYYGPFKSKKLLERFLSVIRRWIPVRTCKLTMKELDRKRGGSARPCLNYHMHYCPGPCFKEVKFSDYRGNLEKLKEILKGNYEKVIDSLVKDMKEASAHLNFEYAARLRDTLYELKQFLKKQNVLLYKKKDADVIGIACLSEMATIVKLIIDRGKVVLKETSHLLFEDKSREELLAAFLYQHYGSGREIPALIIVPFMPAELENISGVFKELTGKRHKIHVPVRGKYKALMDIALKNAEHELKAKLADKIKAEKEIIEVSKEAEKIFGKNIRLNIIDVFDISNIGGKYSVGVCIRLKNGIFEKSKYRRFKIREVKGIDDPAMIKECIKRRYKKGDFPQTILVDGGVTQLLAAEQAVMELNGSGIKSVPFVMSLAKQNEEIYFKKKIVRLDLKSKLLKLFIKGRDEAHRFAVSYHRTLKENIDFKGILRMIKGIGKKRQKIFLEKFGSIEEIAYAPVSKIVNLTGIPITLANEVKLVCRKLLEEKES